MALLCRFGGGRLDSACVSPPQVRGCLGAGNTGLDGSLTSDCSKDGLEFSLLAGSLGYEIDVGSVGDSGFLFADDSVDDSVGGMFKRSFVVSSLDQSLILAIREKRMFFMTSCMTLVLALFSSAEDMMSMFDVSAVTQEKGTLKRSAGMRSATMRK